jgi:hypothetical protein
MELHGMGPVVDPGLDVLITNAVTSDADKEEQLACATSLAKWPDLALGQLLLAYIGAEHHEIVVSAPTAMSALRQIQSLFGKVATVTLAALDRQFREMRCTEQGNVTKHVTDLCALAARVNSQHGHEAKQHQHAPSAPAPAPGHQPQQQKGGGAKGVRAICAISASFDPRIYLDSASSENLVDDVTLLHSYKPFSSPLSLQMADPAAVIEAYGSGNLHLQCEAGLVVVHEVLFAPSVGKRLLSIGRCHRDTAEGGMGWRFSFVDGGLCHIATASGMKIATCSLEGTLYPTPFGIEPVQPAPTAPVVAAVGASPASVSHTLAEWHRILGHVSCKSIIEMSKRDTGIKIVGSLKPITCDACKSGKTVLNSYKSRPASERATTAGERVHVDCVHMPESNGLTGFALATDEHTGQRTVHCFKSNTEVRRFLMNLVSWYSVQHKAVIRCFHLDRGVEFANDELKTSCAELGIKLEFTAPHCSSSAGTAEKSNRTIVDDSRTLLIAAKLKEVHWPHAVRYAVQIRNRTALARLHWKSPSEALTGKKPTYTRVRFYRLCCCSWL